MILLFWGITISVVGKILLVVGVLMAHSKIAHEHRIDSEVLHTFHTEKILTIIGLTLIILGYVMEVYFYGFIPSHTCPFIDCFQE